MLWGDADFIEKGKTDIYGKITLPTASEGFIDNDGKVNVDNINVIVSDEIGVISNAYVKHNEDDSITVTLPENKFIGYDNRVTVTVLDSIGKAMAEIVVTVNDTVEKSYTDKTNENGQIVVPPLSEDMTDSEGKAKVNGYNVLIEDETKPIENAFITIGEGQINVMLPDGVLIDINNRITATVTDSEDKPVKDMTVIFTDTLDITESNVTDENGRATVPPTNIDITDFNGYGEVNGYIVTVENETAPIEKAYIKHTSEVLNEDGTVKEAENISVTLPENVSFSYDNRITVTVAKKSDNSAVKDMTVIVSETVVKTDESTETPIAKSLTDKTGIVTLPGITHSAYIFGYDEGTFRPNSNMTRAEAAAIFARLVSERKDETIKGTSSFADVSAKDWYSKEVGYLEKYGIIKGYNDNTFKPDESVTRAEFVAMTVRFNALFNDVEKKTYTVNYTDVAKSYWAYSDIAYAKNIGWLNGYADGTFKGDNAITRAEVVTVVNRATGRNADTDYINKNLSVLNKFTDIKDNSMWYFADVIESANTHIAVTHTDGETWVK